MAQSLGGFTAPLVCAQLEAAALVFVNAMIPVPGETANAWWDAVGSERARIEAATVRRLQPRIDLETYFLHDVAPDVAAEGEPYQRNEAEAAFGSVCAFDAWPDARSACSRAPMTGSSRRSSSAGSRANGSASTPDVRPGGHLIALANPRAVAEYLVAAAP